MLIRAFIYFLLVFAVFVTASCSKKEPLEPKIEYVYVGENAKVPDGAVRYCWEEPIAKREKIGPGLNLEGTWYYPSHNSVRKVRSGRWRPCRKKSF